MIVYKLVFLSILGVSTLWLIRIFLCRTGLIFMVKKQWTAIQDCFHVYQSFKVPEFNQNMQENQIYRKVSLYLHSLPSIEDSDFTNLVSGKKANDIVLFLDPNQTVEDNFLGARVYWINHQRQQQDSNDNGHSRRTLVLRIRKADKRRILRPYLQYIHTVVDEIEQGNRDLKLYMNINNGQWKSVPFSHPSTFETMAMETDLKNKIKSDLESFLKGKQYYNRLGRVWKRSFLLYGPSGTGKTSFIAAMSNFLSYDVYDIDLSKVVDDSELKLLILQTTSKSIMVIEDLDRFLMEKPTGVSSLGILNFMDGLLNSCCVEERIMVFTMNSKDNVDPVTLRPGRVDLHIPFPLCDFTAFKSLANSYLGVREHKLFQRVEEMFQTGASLSPAEIGELMLSNRSSPSRAIKSVIGALQTDGDGRGSGRTGRRLFDNTATSEPDSGGGLGSEGLNTAKEFQKLYGFLRMRSGNWKSPSLDGKSSPKQG